MQLTEKHILKSFNYFYNNLYNEKLTYTPKTQQLCESFIELLIKRYENIERLGENFLWQYFVFQFKYWSELEVTSFNKRINLSFIIGKKAFDRYLSRDIEYDWQTIQDGTSYSRKDFRSAIGIKEERQSEFNSDDMYRREHFNEELGLSNCIINTSLYDPNSKYCIECNFVEDCKMVQKKKYPKIYKNRRID